MAIKKPRQRADNGLRNIFREHLRERVVWTTVETGLTAGGVADSNYLMPGGVEGWVEYKACDANKVKFQPEQIGWHMRRARFGGRTWIAVRKQHAGGVKLGAAVDELWMVPGCFIEAVRDNGLACGHGVQVGEGSPARWDWQRVRALLGGKVPRHN